MTGPETNRAAARRILEDIISHGRTELIDTLIAPDFRTGRAALQTAFALFGPPAGPAADAPPSRERFRQGLAGIKAALPDLHHRIHELHADGDVVAGRWTLEATHTTPFLGSVPSGRRLAMDEIGFMRFHDGQLVEFWGIGDELGFVRQLGLGIAAATP